MVGTHPNTNTIAVNSHHVKHSGLNSWMKRKQKNAMKAAQTEYDGEQKQWDFQEQFHHCCANDVNVLVEACKKFQSIIGRITTAKQRKTIKGVSTEYEEKCDPFQ